MCDWRDAVRCRNRAEMLRTIADETDHDGHKQSLHNVAEYYEKIAAAMERDLRKTPAPA